ncbi:MAG: SDR family NAD(P)-dependent oxidoreductase, partial [Spirochaetaceae bacterium]|nr:SDR family NAD(P)-dependent oxidoreductase [Spirochaetaceae bacterium]
AFKALRDEGGWIWFVEGHGSDDRIMDGLSVYGAAKRGLAYLWRALAHEARGTRVKIGALSPGIMATDFLFIDRDGRDPEDRARVVRILNILADKPETVAAFAAPRILSAERSGTRIAWLTGAKIASRFFVSPFVKRRILED